MEDLRVLEAEVREARKHQGWKATLPATGFEAG